MVKYLCSFLFVVFVCGNLLSQNLVTVRLDSLMNVLEQYNKAMGTLVITTKAAPFYQRSIGYCFDKEKKRTKLTNDTRYRIGSITKMFTAVMVFQLIEENRLHLSTTLSEFFPTLPNAAKITIADLLSHRSGLYNYTADWDSWRFDYKTPEEILKIIAAKKPEFEPRSKTAYSNSNYLILGYIIEKICSKPYAQELKERITTKAKLINTYYGGKIGAGKNEVGSYAFENGVWKKQSETDMAAAGGAGAIISTASDLALFAHQLFSGLLISKESLNQMLTIKDGQGLGVEQIPFYDMTVYGHSGQIDFFQSWLLYFPKDTTAVVYLSNGYGGITINDILKGILHIYFNKPYTIPDYKTIALSAAELTEYVGVYICEQPKMEIVTSIKDGNLYAQATGQRAFALEATDKLHFKFDGAGILFQFFADKNGFVLKQGGGSYLFKRKK